MIPEVFAQLEQALATEIRQIPGVREKESNNTLGNNDNNNDDDNSLTNNNESKYPICPQPRNCQRRNRAHLRRGDGPPPRHARIARRGGGTLRAGGFRYAGLRDLPRRPHLHPRGAQVQAGADQGRGSRRPRRPSALRDRRGRPEDPGAPRESQGEQLGGPV